MRHEGSLHSKNTPWERLNSFRRFKIARDLGRQRTYAAVARKYAVKEETVKRGAIPKQYNEVKPPPAHPIKKESKPADVQKSVKVRKRVPGQTPQTNLYERGALGYALHQGQSNHAVAEDFKRDRKTVRYWKSRLQTPGGGQRKKNPGSGRPRCTTPQTDRWIRYQIMKQEDVNASQIHEEMSHEEGKSRPSRRTVLRRVREAPVKPVRRLEKPLLTDAAKEARFNWAEAHLNWSIPQWEHIVWSDESPFHIWLSRKGQIVWIRTDKDDYKKRIESMAKHGGGGFQVWGCFHAHGVGPLVRAQSKMDSHWYHGILTVHAMPFMANLIRSHHKKRKKHDPIWHYQHDNAPPHTAGLNNSYLQSKETQYNGNFRVLEWPSSSPDLSPIENLWSIIKRKLKGYQTKPKNLDELWARVKNEWEKLPEETLLRLAQSMPKRVDEVIKKEGWTIKY